MRKLYDELTKLSAAIFILFGMFLVSSTSFFFSENIRSHKTFRRSFQDS